MFLRPFPEPSVELVTESLWSGPRQAAPFIRQLKEIACRSAFRYGKGADGYCFCPFCSIAFCFIAFLFSRIILVSAYMSSKDAFMA